MTNIFFSNAFSVRFFSNNLLANLILFLQLLTCLASKRNLAAVVDLGSTGTRARVFEYTFDRRACGGRGSVSLVLPEKSSQTRPGVASLLSAKRTPEKLRAIADYLQSIKQEIDKHVPAADRARTPVWLFSTAGMRQFGPAELESHLSLMREIVAGEWREYQTQPEWIDVLDGEHEGLFSWLFLNHLRERRGKRKTAALVEMGGASAQVVMEARPEIWKELPSISSAPANSSIHRLQPGVVRLNLCDKPAIVVVKSFQGFGRQLALQRFLLLQRESHSPLSCIVSDVIYPILSIAEASVAIENIGVQKLGDHMTQPPSLTGALDGTFDSCSKAVKDFVFGQSTELPLEWSPIPFPIEDDIDIVGIENFYHMHEMVGKTILGQPAQFSVRSLRSRAQELCALQTVAEIAKQLNPRAEFEKAATACFGLTFMAEFLEKVLLITPDRSIQALTAVDDVTISWPGGLLLTELPRLLQLRPELLTKQQERDEL